MAGAGDADDRRQDPRVERLRPDPSEPPRAARTLEGLWGHSDRPGFRRLYFTTALDAYAEFRVDDVLATADIPADRPPFLGEQATRVTLGRDAQLEITQSTRAGAVDEFDLDVRFGFAAGRAANAPGPSLDFAICPKCATGFDEGTCPPVTDITCAETCQTCHTECGPFTCGPTCDTCGATFCEATCADTCAFCPRR